MRKILLIGIGAGHPEHITIQAINALKKVDVVFITDKGADKEELARFRREMGERLAGLLDDAWDALDTDPPHPRVARERLETAREAIRGEIEWLNKSLG